MCLYRTYLHTHAHNTRSFSDVIYFLHTFSGESIKVFVRVRPPDPTLESELTRGACLDVTSDKTLTVYSKPEPKVFTFDHVADKDTTQASYFITVKDKCPY